MKLETHLIRPYRDEDEAGVVRLWAEVFHDAPAWNDPTADIRRKQTVQADLFLVAVSGVRIAGTVMAGFDGHRGWIYYLAVDPDLRRRGLGRALMQEAEQRLEASGCTKVNLQVRASNPEGVRFYEQAGYRVEDRISMGRRLDKPGTG
ncbi:MAG: GNAT family acetyltransferase [Myxococcota bacterium]